MKVNFTVNVDTSTIAEDLKTRFGLGSDAQYEWSMIVFDGSANYMPFKEGLFFADSYNASQEVAAQGELVYTTSLDYDYLPKFLWDGKSQHGAIVIENYTTETNALAGGRWVERAAADNKDAWVAAFQEKINNGDV